jgi:hypothetical protein
MLTKSKPFTYPDLPRWVREANTCVLGLMGYGPCEGPMEAHHEPPRSQGGQDDDTICVCRKHHRLRHDRPNEFFDMISMPMIEALKKSYMRSYLRSLLSPDGEVTPPKVKVPKRKATPKAEPAPDRWSVKPNSKKRKESKLRPYDWRLNMQSEVCNQVPD